MAMFKEISKLLDEVNKATGINSAVVSGEGKVLFRTSDFDLPGKDDLSCCDDIACVSGVTLLPIGGAIVALCGEGKEYSNYAELIRAAAEREEGIGRTLTQSDKLRLFLLGKLDSSGEEELRSVFDGAFDAYVLTLITQSAHKKNELKGFLDTAAERGDLVISYGEKSIAFIKRCGEEDEYRSAGEFAVTLYDSIKEELRIELVINVGGTVHSFTELRDAFVKCSVAHKFGLMTTHGGHIFSYKEFVMPEILSDMPTSSLRRYLKRLLGGEGEEILGDEELMNTAEEFMKNSLNISETGRNMYMHRNTLIYRLDKIEKATGLNLRNFNDAVTFRLLTLLSILSKDDAENV